MTPIAEPFLATSAPFLAFGLFVGMLLLLETGRRLGAHRVARDPDAARVGAGAVEAAVFALFGLLIAFTFSGAAGRFDARRQLVAEEANAIGTAWLRVDLLPPASQAPMRDLFRQYLDSRLDTYRKLPDIKAAIAELGRSTDLQGRIWTTAVAASGESTTMTAGLLLLPALNAMIDITTTRFTATQIHPPIAIYVMLVLVALISAMLAGEGMATSKSRSWLHIIGFAAVIAATVYVILDIEYPRFGLIRVDAADQVLVDLRRSMD